LGTYYYYDSTNESSVVVPTIISQCTSQRGVSVGGVTGFSDG